MLIHFSILFYGRKGLPGSTPGSSKEKIMDNEVIIRKIKAAYESYEELLDDPEIDAVYIASLWHFPFLQTFIFLL